MPLMKFPQNTWGKKLQFSKILNINNVIIKWLIFQKEITEISSVKLYQPLKRQSRLQQTTNFAISFLVFDKNKV